MDFATPVASPDPIGHGIQTLSGLLGVKQAQQNLQTGQIQQDTAQAESQQAQQKNAELSAVGNLTKNAYKSGLYQKPDGGFDNQKFANDVAQVAPTYGQAIANDATVRAGEVYQNQKTLFGLNADRRKQVGDALGSLAAQVDPSTGQPTANHNQLIDTIENLRQQNPDDPAYSRMLTSMAASVPPQASGPQLQQVLRNMAMMTGSATTDQTNPAISTMQGSNGLQAVNTNPSAVGGIGPRGSGLAQGLGPTDQPEYKASVASATSSAASRASGSASSDIDRSNQISANVKSAPAGIQTTKQIDDLADQIHSGKFAGWLSSKAAAAGVQESTYARQLLDKDLGIMKTQLTSAAPSDSRAATILSGTPDSTSDPQTIHGAMDYIRGSLRQNQAQGQNLNAYKAKHPDLSGFQGADDSFTGGAGPLVHEFLSLKSPAEQSAFYKRNFGSAQEALQFRNQAFAASHTLGLDSANR